MQQQMDLLACSAGVFFGRAECFARESAFKGLLFLLSKIFLCHKIKDGGYNDTNINKQRPPAQNMPALQANGPVYYMTTGAFALVGSYGFEPA